MERAPLTKEEWLALEKKANDLRHLCLQTTVWAGSGHIGGGMLPKLNNCMDAVENGVSRVHILDGRIPHCLLLEIFTNKGIGTAILRKDEIKDYDVQ